MILYHFISIGHAMGAQLFIENHIHVPHICLVLSGMALSFTRSSCRPNSGNSKPPETVAPDIQPRIDTSHQFCSASWPSNVVSNSANTPQIQNELTESTSHQRVTFTKIVNKGASVCRRLRVSRGKNAGAFDLQSPSEPRPANHDGLPTTILAPVSSTTISGYGDTGGLDVDFVSRAQGGQVSP